MDVAAGVDGALPGDVAGDDDVALDDDGAVDDDRVLLGAEERDATLVRRVRNVRGASAVEHGVDERLASLGYRAPVPDGQILVELQVAEVWHLERILVGVEVGLSVVAHRVVHVGIGPRRIGWPRAVVAFLALGPELLEGHVPRRAAAVHEGAAFGAVLLVRRGEHMAVDVAERVHAEIAVGADVSVGGAAPAENVAEVVDEVRVVEHPRPAQAELHHLLERLRDRVAAPRGARGGRLDAQRGALVRGRDVALVHGDDPHRDREAVFLLVLRQGVEERPAAHGSLREVVEPLQHVPLPRIRPAEADEGLVDADLRLLEDGGGGEPAFRSPRHRRGAAHGEDRVADDAEGGDGQHGHGGHDDVERESRFRAARCRCSFHVDVLVLIASPCAAFPIMPRLLPASCRWRRACGSCARGAPGSSAAGSGRRHRSRRAIGRWT